MYKQRPTQAIRARTPPQQKDGSREAWKTQLSHKPPLGNLYISTSDNVKPRSSNHKLTQITMQPIDVAKHHSTTTRGHHARTWVNLKVRVPKHQAGKKE